MVALVDDRRVDGQTGEAGPGADAAESGADDDDL